MSKFKSYEQFNESSDIASLFHSAHAAIDKTDIQPLKKFIGKPKFPTQEEFDAAVEFLDADPDCFFYNKKDLLNPILYWKGPFYHGFFGGLNMEALKMMQTDKRFEYKKKDIEKHISKKDYVNLFSHVDKKILIPTFIDMYKEIPDNQKYDVFTDLYSRSEYGFQMFPIEIIKDCFSKRKLSTEWKERMEQLKKDMKLNSDGTLTVYRGENVQSAKSDDAFSWTLDKKTAKFFSERFSKNTGKINSKKIDPSEIIDYLTDRNESEIILFPKKFGIMNESLTPSWVSIIHSKFPPVRVIISDDEVRFIQQHANMGRVEWFILDKDSKFHTRTTASEQWIVQRMAEIFDTAVMVKPYEKDLDKILQDPIFSKWWKEATHKYRGAIIGTKFGI